MITDRERINKVFCSFYKNLYTSDIPFNKQKCATFLNTVSLPKLDSDVDVLEKPVTLAELKRAAESLTKDKSPGSDGIPPELYLVVWDIVGQLALDSINYAIKNYSFHGDQKTAIISLLLKSGKDQLECSSYRPISLICGDVKMC